MSPSPFDRALEVRLGVRSGESSVVGRLVQRGRDILFEYASDFASHGLSLSPFALPLRTGVQQEMSRVFGGLHGVFHDSLPDGWGLRLMDRELTRQGFDPSRVTPLERLQFVGTRGMGALTYQPAMDIAESNDPFSLDRIAEQSERVYEGSAEEVLPQLVSAGGSAAGARPKVLVAYNADTDEMRAGADEIPNGFQGYLIKFPTREDGADIGAVEMAYADMARDAGIDVPPTRLFTTRHRKRCFGVQRFDRVIVEGHTERRHVHTLGGLLQVSHREFGATYGHYLAATTKLTRDRRATSQAFRRMVFNILAHNRDDHVKNFAFLMKPDGTWHLAPAYDLVYAPGPAGEHSLMVGSEAARPAFRHLLGVAKPEQIASDEVSEMVQQVSATVAQWPMYASRYRVARRTQSSIAQSLDHVRRDMAPLNLTRI